MDNTEPEAQTTLSYFAEDGSYGNAVGLMVLDTTKWTALDWEIIDSVSDNERPTVARLIAESYEEAQTTPSFVTSSRQSTGLHSPTTRSSSTRTPLTSVRGFLFATVKIPRRNWRCSCTSKSCHYLCSLLC